MGKCIRLEEYEKHKAAEEKLKKVFYFDMVRLYDKGFYYYDEEDEYNYWLKKGETDFVIKVENDIDEVEEFDFNGDREMRLYFNKNSKKDAVLSLLKKTIDWIEEMDEWPMTENTV